MVGCEVLEVESRDYLAKDGSPRTFRSVLFSYGGKVLKLSYLKEVQQKLSDLKRKSADFEVELSTFGDELVPRLSVSGAVVSKSK